MLVSAVLRLLDSMRYKNHGKNRLKYSTLDKSCLGSRLLQHTLNNIYTPTGITVRKYKNLLPSDT